MSTCHELSEVYELYALGVLDPDECDELDAHIRRGCPACSAGIRQALTSAALLATLPDQIDPPRRLRKRILASVKPEVPSWNWLGAGTWVAATAALLIGILWFARENYHRGQELAQLRFEIRRDAADLVNARLALQFLNEPETRQVTFGEGQPKPPHGRVMLNSNRGVMLLVANLPPAPEGKLYEMWLIPRGGKPQPAGMFQSDARGNALHLREGSLSVAATEAVAVTLEPQSGSSSPTSTPLFVAGL